MGRPAPASVTLFNRLVTLPHDREVEIGQIAWQLRNARTKNPSDPKTAIAYLQALLMLGHAGEAIALVEQLWSWRRILDNERAITFSGQLVELGMFGRCIEYIHSRFGDDPPAASIGTLVQAAVGVGDLERATRYLALEDRGALGIRVIRHIQQTELSEHFENHQRIIFSAISGQLVGYEAEMGFADGNPELSNRLFVRSDRPQRRKLEEEIDGQLAEYFEANGLPAGAQVPLITTIVLDLRDRCAPLIPLRAA